MAKNYLFVVGLILSVYSFCYAQTTGKIAGKVIESGTGEPLPGANVIIEGTGRGAATGSDGFFYIINVPPGAWTIRVEMMGYETKKYNDFRVSVNRTSNLTAELKATVLEGQVVVVQADKISIKKDQTSSIRNVSSEEIDLLPVEDTGAVIEMQTGVVGGHFRGGRIGEVSYMIDGMQVDNALNRSKAVDLDKDAVQDMEVITGTFDAEYGNAMSGVVNLVTKDGQDQFHGKAEGHLANYITSHDNFIGLEATDINRNQDYRFEFEGPVWRNRIGFYTNLRLENNKNHLNGIRRFNVNDFSDYSEIPYNTQAGGDSAFVPLNDNKSTKFFGKLNFRLKNFKLYLSYTKNDGQWQNYNHTFKYVPDGKATSFNNSDMVALHLNHMFSPKAFYEFKVWYTKNKSGYYLYKDPSDPQYIHDMYLANSQYTGFYTGGQEKTYNKSTTQDWNTKIDLTWQVSLHHSLKSGFKFTQHRLENLNSYVRNKWYGTAYEFVRYEPHLTPSSTLSADYYEKEPLEMAAYFQDKMEFNEMVLKLGIRFDYLNPNTTYPSQRRNPDNKLLFDENTDRMSSYPEAEVKYQLSPRFGLTYQLAKTAMLHLSYGHFFQIPPFYALYQNADFLVGTTNYETRMGNGQLKPERTIQYEIGLWQEITEGMSLDMSLFYKDIYDLLTMNIFTTYNQIRYGLYSNKDYGNARGLEMKYEAVYGSFTGVVNYTLQYTRGVADNPTTTFTRAGNNQDPISRLIPLNWDQRHTVNIQLGYVKKEYGVTLVGNYGSGFPYTYEPIGENPLSQVNLYPNNNPKPSFLTFDLRAYYDIFLAREQKVRFTFVAYNLLDRLNELSVSPETGRANQSIILDTQLAGHRSDFNDYYDRINNPAAFSAPRMIKIGMGYYF